ncbi:hypothetical protein CICLE_v10003115mg [Citrus x clementina]|uniref:SHSP domain-containing protein n=1 Tax=Citrus clementina TaxID=85681 RepID=V4T2A4_CITCL|nr:hypothetical protein CICLE_v10003115mg [Citrus x clementina]
MMTILMIMASQPKPFEILKQTLLIIPKGVDHHQTLVLARAKWKETPPAQVITLDILGIKKDNVKIEVEENRVLRMRGERKSSSFRKWVLRITVPKLAEEKKRHPKVINID